MIEIKNKQDCCGCTACASICPNKCITMEQDSEGFLYPIVNKDACCDCHLCEKKCPVIGKEKKLAVIGEDKHETNRKALNGLDSVPQAYVCFNNDGTIRENSTSGGVFSVLAEYVLRKNGIVCGVIIDDEHKIVHAFAEYKKELVRMRRSKYVQSDQKGIYLQIKKELLKGRYVLYSGTPCQVAGLKSFLGKEYKELITVDIFCHGVGSPAYWDKYVSYMQKKMNSRIREIRFREKTYGYNSACLAIYFENGKSSHKGHDDDLYWSPFSKNMIYRPSCYSCAFKTVNHVSDFSIGDYWNVSEFPKEYAAANGCSLVLCHSKKSDELLHELKKEISIHEVELGEAMDINGGHQPSMLIACPRVPELREEWFLNMGKYSVLELNRRYLPLSVTKRIKCSLKPVLYRLKILDIIKRKIR